MSQSIIISRVVLDPLRISFTLGQSLPDTVFWRTLIGSQESRGQGSRVSTSLSFGDGSVHFFLCIYVYRLVPQKCKEEAVFFQAN